MPYKILSHTADLRMKARGKTLEALFKGALIGMMKVLKEKGVEGGKIIKRRLVVESVNPTALLVDFLNEVLALTQTHHEIYTKVDFKELTREKVAAELEGIEVKKFDEDIKAVTYHEANVKKNKKGEWETILIFDI